jgi:hypothetical protein
LHVATHDQVALGIVAEPEGVFTHDIKSPFSIERQGSWISFPHSEPERRGAGRVGSRKNVRHELVSQSRAMVRSVHVDPLDLDRSRKVFSASIASASASSSPARRIRIIAAEAEEA